MASSSPPPPLDQLFLGRQPILDVQQTLVGYELLFRDSSENRAENVSPGVATASVVCHAFTELGLASALGGRKGFIIADAAFLLHEAIEALPPECVVLEVDAGIADDPLIITRCQELGEKGYALCLKDPLRMEDSLQPLLRLSMFVKTNVKATQDDALAELLKAAKVHRVTAIASHVETQDDYQRVRGLGFEFFQGYYFAQPVTVTGKRLDPQLRSLIQIINLINRDAEAPEIEQAFKGEAALTMKLLRLTNSAGLGLRVRIGSVRQAISIIGRRHIQRWLQLLLYGNAGESGDIARNPLMQLAALKGNFMERLARRTCAQQGEEADNAFLVGLLSLMPVALGMPIEEILEQLAIAMPLREALLQRQGDLGLLLELTDAYDADDPARADVALARMGHRITRDTLNQSLTESIAWVQSLEVAAT